MKINNGMSLVKTESKLPVRLEDLTRFALIGREKLNSVRAGIRAINKLGLAKEVREQKLEEGQMLGEALLDAEARIGDLLKVQTIHGGSLNYKSGRKTPEFIRGDIRQVIVSRCICINLLIYLYYDFWLEISYIPF
ncbi:MAG: hypothetical protein ABIJ40_17560 [Bacteroidota bacterium]